jgi:hypothetical protein
MPSLAVALYISSLITIGAQILSMMLGFPLMNPLSAIMIFMFFQELSKLVIQFSGSEDGEDSK